MRKTIKEIFKNLSIVRVVIEVSLYTIATIEFGWIGFVVVGVSTLALALMQKRNGKS